MRQYYCMYFFVRYQYRQVSALDYYLIVCTAALKGK